MHAEKIYQAIESMFANHDFKLRNVFVHDWEADHFSVTSSKYTYEIEVKISRSDFFCDFKKPKHDVFKSELRNYKTCPNKFYYACPVGLIESHEVPDYAGLIWRMDSGGTRIIKKAPFIHKDIFNHREMLFDKYYYKWVGLKAKVWELEDTIQQLKNEKQYQIK